MVRKYITLIALVGAVGTVSACSSDPGQKGPRKTNSPIIVQTSPVADYAGLYVGIEKEFFKDRGITLKPTTGTSGAATVASVMSGTVPIGGSAIVPLLNAHTKGVPVTILGPAGSGRAGGADYIAVVTGKGSKIKSAGDLQGRRIASNGLENVLTMATSMAIDKDGGDHQNAKYVNIPLPDMAGALRRGDVDAAITIEPFLTKLKDEGYRVVTYPNRAVDSQMLVSGYFTSKKYAKAHPTEIKAFMAGLKESQKYAEGHPDEVRRIVAKYAKIDAKTLKKMVLPSYVDTATPAAIEAEAKSMQVVGMVDSRPQIDGLIHGAD